MLVLSKISYYLLFTSILIHLVIAKPSDNRIIGGDIARPGQFPFIVSLDVNVTDYYQGHYCGASILNEQWILTAAHCVITFQPEEVTILTGTNLLNNTNAARYMVEKLIANSGFNFDNLTDDIALVKINGSIELNDLVQTIEIGEVTGNDVVTIAGWGATSEDDLAPNELRYLNISALTPEDCDAAAAGSIWGDILERGPGQVCIMGPIGIGACHGDSGGPMVFNGKLVGVTSYTLNNWCADGYPDVYTRTAFYVDWIQDVISKN